MNKAMATKKSAAVPRTTHSAAALGLTCGLLFTGCVPLDPYSDDSVDSSESDGGTTVGETLESPPSDAGTPSTSSTGGSTDNSTATTEFDPTGVDSTTGSSDGTTGSSSTSEATGTDPIPFCGDGFVEGDEDCDDGNSNDFDECPNDCTDPVCGDGETEGDEECDDGNNDDLDSCPSDCTLAVCGDGEVEGEEECDDGNSINTDNCPDDCTTPVCGDGVVEGDEECEQTLGATKEGAYGHCRDDCHGPYYTFVTPIGYPGSFQHNGKHGYEAAVEICQQTAESGNLPGSYLPWLSHPNLMAHEVFDHDDSTPYVLLKHIYNTTTAHVIANNWEHLTNQANLKIPIRFDESGAFVGTVPVWTGTSGAGEYYSPGCESWTSKEADYTGRIGSSGSTDFTWTSVSPWSCAVPAHLYCFRQETEN